jgi:microcystin-dependent protein
MATPFIAQIIPFGFNFAPHTYAQCNGQILSIAQNTALFSLLGTTYGGNGQTTFALPDLRGRAPMHHGGSQGPGLSPYSFGQQSGAESHTLLSTEMPAHSHSGQASVALPCGTGPGTSNTAAANFAGVTTRPSYADAANGNLASASSGAAGGGQPHSNLQPLLALNFCIALQGIFPSRN